jgi:RNA polymerase sigma-B factor
MARSAIVGTDPPAVRHRNALVLRHLNLVHQQVNRLRHLCSEPVDDLVQIGRQGLIVAAERFDPDRGVAFSSFAVPYIQGHIRHHIRDRVPVVRSSWRLRQLHAQMEQLNATRLHGGQPPLGEEELASRLGCRVSRIRQARELHRALQCTSLDRPCGTDDGTPLQETLEARGPQPLEGLAWQELWERLAPLPVDDRKLLLDCLVRQRPRRDVAAEMGWSVPRLSRRLRQCRLALQERLMAEGWGPAGPWPAGRPAVSSAH